MHRQEPEFEYIISRLLSHSITTAICILKCIYFYLFQLVAKSNVLIVTVMTTIAVPILSIGQHRLPWNNARVAVSKLCKALIHVSTKKTFLFQFYFKNRFDGRFFKNSWWLHSANCKHSALKYFIKCANGWILLSFIFYVKLM